MKCVEIKKMSLRNVFFDIYPIITKKYISLHTKIFRFACEEI